MVNSYSYAFLFIYLCLLSVSLICVSQRECFLLTNVFVVTNGFFSA